METVKTNLVLVAVSVVLVLSGSAWADLTDGLVAHWTFDEGEGDVANDSAGENDGTIYGAQWTDGQIGGALEFDGVDDYIELPHNAITTREFTIAAWANQFGPGGGVDSENVIFQQRDDDSVVSTADSTVVLWAGAVVKSTYPYAGAIIRDSEATTQLVRYPRTDFGEWHHYVLSVNLSDITFYVDGEEVARTTSSQGGDYVTDIDHISIGKHSYRGADRGFFNGLIDDVRLYNRGLSADEIWDIYDEGVGGYPVFLDDFADDETRGRFVMEAENYSARSLGSSSAWWEVDGSDSKFIEGPNVGQVAPTRKAGARDNYMETLGDGTCNVAPIDESYDGPFLDYRVSVETLGTYRLYARWLGRDGGSDSLYAFILKPDETVLTGAGPNYFLYHQYRSSWIWDSRGVRNTTQCAGAGFPHKAVWTISQPGIYTIRIAQRESTTALDALVFQTEGLSGPSGFGPPQSQYIPGPARLTEYHVDAVRGSDTNNGLSRKTAFANIQMGIDVAEDGDTVLVWPGVYTEEIIFKGKAITVRSAGEPAVLEAPNDYAVSFYYGERSDSVLKNFIIRNSFMAVFIAGASPTISNLTVVDNQYGIEAYAASEPDISSSIFWNNLEGDLFQCEARYSDVQESSEGESNISENPLFVDSPGGDYHLRSERGRYWPEHDVWVLDNVTSPCVDGGDPAVDIGKEPTPNGGRINMGAYGGTAYASMSEGIPGDINGDGRVNMIDLAVLADNWLRQN